MKTRFKNRKSAECIKKLMEYKGIKKAPDLARALIEDGIMSDKRQDKEAVRYTADIINRHLSGSQLPDRKWMDIYCRYFKCSADYLMGYIENPTQEITDVCDKTGLSERAASKLLDKAKHNRMYSRIISWMIESNTFDTIISRIDRFIQVKWLQAVSAQEEHPDKDLDKTLLREEERLFFISHEFTNLVQDIAREEVK